MELLKLLSTSELVAQIINFLLLLFLLRVFLWKPILKLLDERKERISSDLKNAADIKNEVEGLKADYQSKLNSIEETARVMIKDAQGEAGKKAEEIKKKAHLEAERLIALARSEIKYEVLKVKDELKDEIIDLTIRAVETVISEKLTEEDDLKIIEDFLKNVEKSE